MNPAGVSSKDMLGNGFCLAERSMKAVNMKMSQLNKRYGVAESVKILAQGNNPPFISVSNRSASALISLYGGQVLSFRPQDEKDDLLFLSSKADFSGEQPIRGGIPVCWPWFGADPGALNRPNHGFARNALWSVAQTEICSDYEIRLQLRLQQSDEIQAIWPQTFELMLEITVADSLTLELVAQNKGVKPFSMTQALHSYFRVSDIDHIKVSGLEERNYLDKLDDGRRKHQSGALAIAGEVDRIYTGVQNHLLIDDKLYQRHIRIASQGMHSTIVWNPWAEASADLPDLAADDYKRFICVETGHVDTDVVTVDADSEFRLHANFKILPYSM